MAKQVKKIEAPAVDQAQTKMGETAADSTGHHEVQSGLLSMPEFWLAVSFVLFFLIFFKPIKKAVLSLLDGHADKVRRELEEAKKLREDAHQLLRNIEHRQEAALAEANAIVQNAMIEAKHIRTNAMADAEELVKRHQKHALDSIAIAEGLAMAEIRNSILDAAMAASKQLLSEINQPDQENKLLEKLISDIPKKLH